MRSNVNFTLHTILAAALVAFAATSAAAADAYLKLGDIKGDASAARGDGKGWIEASSYWWGTTHGVAPSSSKSSRESAAPSISEIAVNDPGASGTKDSKREASSAMPAGKRQHKPMTISKPMDSGSMTFRGLVTACAPGTTHKSATMVTQAYTYEFRDVVITNCPVSGGGSLPTEEISFNYAKVVTKATTAADRSMWDLKKNER